MKKNYEAPNVKIAVVGDNGIMAASGTNGWQDKRGIVTNEGSQTSGDAGTAHAKTNFLWEDGDDNLN